MPESLFKQSCRLEEEHLFYRTPSVATSWIPINNSLNTLWRSSRFYWKKQTISANKWVYHLQIPVYQKIELLKSCNQFTFNRLQKLNHSLLFSSHPWIRLFLIHFSSSKLVIPNNVRTPSFWCKWFRTN